MTRTIEIKFLAQPQLNDTFSYKLSLNGAPFTYVTRPFVTQVYLTENSAPDGVKLGGDLTETLANTLTGLTSHHYRPDVSYAISGNSILVTITYTGELALFDVVVPAGKITVDYLSADISFEGGINPNTLRKAYNNDIITFSAGESAEALHAVVEAAGMNIRLFPDPAGKFNINLKPYVSALINTRNFEDRLLPYLNNSDAATYVYRSNSGCYLELEVKFTIALPDSQTAQAIHNLAWFAGAEQPGFANTFSRNALYVFTPFQAETANTYCMKYWQGYPFDITVYCPSSSLTFKNTANLLAQAFNTEEKVTRIALSDGRTDETLENLLPLATGQNTIRLMPGNTETETDKFLMLDKVPFTKGVYLKWLNKYGGYSYWLFEDTYTIDRSTKQLGELDRDDANVEAMQARAIPIGKTSQDSLKTITEMLEPHERDVVEGLLDSPKIYLFTGRPFARAEAGSWIAVTLKTTGARLKNARQPLTSFSFDIELPERYTQTL
ncbi:MAG: hypothetical protein ACO1N9_05545 [Flavobacterium sp.]